MEFSKRLRVITINIAVSFQIPLKLLLQDIFQLFKIKINKTKNQNLKFRSNPKMPNLLHFFLFLLIPGTFCLSCHSCSSLEDCYDNPDRTAPCTDPDELCTVRHEASVTPSIGYIAFRGCGKPPQGITTGQLSINKHIKSSNLISAT